MQVIIHGKSIEINEQIKTAVEKVCQRLQKKHQKYFTGDINANVTLERNNFTYKVTIYIQLLNKNYLQCKTENNDLFAAIKQTLLPLERQIRYLKTIADNSNVASVGELLMQKEESENDFLVDVTNEQNN